VVYLSIGDVIFGLARLLAAEGDRSPFFNSRRINIHRTCELYTKDAKHALNTAIGSRVCSIIW
jgi:hypothetical protein